jgi:GDPmannose 4,6-dehydratase
MSKVLVTGVTGQDGSLMVDYLLRETEHDIFGSIRRLSVKNHENIRHLENEKRFKLVNMDLNDAHSIRDIVIDLQPDYFINFAAQSFVAGSWDYPIQTWETDSTSVLHILESIRRFNPNCKFLNAGSSEEFGKANTLTQNENSSLQPQSPYGASKCAARHIVRVYRESYGLFAIQPWLYNHESPRRGLDFVTRKISSTIAKIKISINKKEKFEPLYLGNIDAQRDWSDAEDFVHGVWLMLNQDQPKNYILSSGKLHTVRDFLDTCLRAAGIDFTQDGEGEQERYLTNSGDIIFAVDPKFYRPLDNYRLCGDPTLAESELSWSRKSTLDDLATKMFKNDFVLLSKQQC